MRKYLVKEAVLVALIDTDSQRDVAFSSSSASDDKPMHVRSISECDEDDHTMDEPIEHRLRHSQSHGHIRLLPPHHLKIFMLNPANKNELMMWCHHKMYLCPQEPFKKSSRFQSKDKSRTKEFGTEDIRKTPVPK